MQLYCSQIYLIDFNKKEIIIFLQLVSVGFRLEEIQNN
jgi:hypothetical protein